MGKIKALIDGKGFRDFDILVMTPAEFVSKAKE